MNTHSQSVTVPVSANTSAEDKTVAILSYLTIVGFVVAIVMHSNRKTRLGAFHLRQSLGLFLLGIALMPVGTILGFVPFVGWLAGLALWMGILALWLVGLISAINGTEKPLPVLGDKFQSWFGKTFTA